MSMVLRITASAAVAASFFSLVTATPTSAREVVAFNGGASPGTIVVRTSERRLYLVLGHGRAIRHPVGVGRAGRAVGRHRACIDGQVRAPRASCRRRRTVRRDKPGLPSVIPGGTAANPMGAAALTLSGGGSYAIHGTNSPSSIGGFVSYGCIRMHNQDIVDLYGRVNVGTPVIVTR